MSKTVVLGISGGIAAYKIPDLVRLLVKEGHHVHCVLTENAAQFVTPLTLATLSGNPVLSGNFESSESGKITHIDLAEKADLMVIAPATANVIAKLAQGIADDLLSTVALAAQGLILVCPAMNVFMWENAATQENFRILEQRGIEILGPAVGELACGYEGCGRMEEPEHIFQAVQDLLMHGESLSERKVLVTAGPTQEFLDPVRFISNPSSGRMGYAIAKAARLRNAEVTLISGPTDLAPPYGVKTIRVTSADEMANAAEAHFSQTDAMVAAAAVSDWKPAAAQTMKQKKAEMPVSLDLVPTPDILASLAHAKKNHQVIVGFAMETENLESHARAKLENKNLDLIVGNLILNNSRFPFGAEENRVMLIPRSGKPKTLPQMSKLRIAHHILDTVAELLTAKSH